jgi:hypothetical protein
MHDPAPEEHERVSRPLALDPSDSKVTLVVVMHDLRLSSVEQLVFRRVQPEVVSESQERGLFVAIVPSGFTFRIWSGIGPHVPFWASAQWAKYVAPGVAHGFA